MILLYYPGYLRERVAQQRDAGGCVCSGCGLLLRLSHWWSAFQHRGAYICCYRERHAGPIPLLLTSTRRKIRLIESSAKCHYLKKLTSKGILRQVFIHLMPPPLLGFCLGCGVAILQVLNLVRNRALNSCRIWSPTQLSLYHRFATPLPPSLFQVRGAIVHKAGSKNTNITDIISSL